MTAIIDSFVWQNTFSTPEITEIWSDKHRTAYYLQFEAALAKVQAELNIIPQKAADEIVKQCKLECLDFDLLRRKTESIGYPILPMVQQLVANVNKVEDKLGEWAHWGTTTQDLTDTATVLQLRDTIELVEQAIKGITAALVQLCEKYKTTPMAARSNLQQAVPISFGFKMARLLATFQRHSQRLAELKPRLLVMEFSGAAGTLATLSEASSYGQPPEKYSKEPIGIWCQRLLAKELGLDMPSIAWHTERDNFAEFSCFLAILTATCAKFATDLKLMMQSEVGEASEPFVQHRGSSSTMPQKRNPIGCAYIHGMASSIRSMANGMIEAVNADHERSTGPWQIEWIMLPQICALSVACLKHMEYLVSGVEVDEKNMQKNLDMSRGAIVSEAVMMGLGKTLGRQYAHDIVYDLCRKAQIEDKSLLELLKANEDIKKAGLKDEELEKLCDPAHYLGLSEVMVHDVLKQIQQKS